MVKKKNTDVDDDETPKNDAVEADGAVFVNRDKYRRALDIVALVSGAKVAATTSDLDNKEKFLAKFAEADVNPKGKEAVRFAYETLLGGLVRTPTEQQDAEVRKEKTQLSNKKKAIESEEGRG